MLQNNWWLIDPYWTYIPPLISIYYTFHPLSTGNSARQILNLILVFVWSIRLTHNYFRREEWYAGVREDWRYNDMRREYGIHWWWISFFVCYVAQQPMLCGFTLPYWAINFSPWASTPFGIIDIFIGAAALAGVIAAYYADN